MRLTSDYLIDTTEKWIFIELLVKARKNDGEKNSKSKPKICQKGQDLKRISSAAVGNSSVARGGERGGYSPPHWHVDENAEW